MPDFSLVVPFLDDSPAYALGVEFGILYAALRSGVTDYSGYHLRDNQDQILLLASRDGWTVEEMKPWDGSWFWISLRK